MVQFPESLPFIHSQRKDVHIQIQALDEQGQRRAHYTPRVQYGVHVRKGSDCHLEEVYDDIFKARNAGNRIRRRLQRTRAQNSNGPTIHLPKALQGVAGRYPGIASRTGT